MNQVFHVIIISGKSHLSFFASDSRVRWYSRNVVNVSETAEHLPFIPSCPDVCSPHNSNASPLISISFFFLLVLFCIAQNHELQISLRALHPHISTGIPPDGKKEKRGRNRREAEKNPSIRMDGMNKKIWDRFCLSTFIPCRFISLGFPKTLN